jgi:hypothetical protein
MKRIIFAISALLLSSLSLAEVTSLSVQFAPNATQYTKGEQVGVTATSNGVGAQYRFYLDNVSTATAVLVSSTNWTTTNSFQIDTFAVNMPAGKYRVRTLVRENANKPETLTKVDFFTVVAPAVTACESIDGKTYSSTVSAPLALGDLSLAQVLSGAQFGLPAGAPALSSVSFDSGTVVVAMQKITARVCTMICINVDVSSAGAEVAGTYTCANNTVSITASGSVPVAPGTLASLLGDSPFPVSVSGPMTINTATDTLTSGTRTFD